MTVSSNPPPAGVPPLQKTNPWIFIIAAIVVLCCACIGVTGLLIAFGPEIMDELGLSVVLPLLPVLV